MSEPVVYTPVTVQTVAYTGTAAASAAIGAQITVVRLVATTDCWVYFTAAGTAATNANGVFLPAMAVEYFRVPTSTKMSAVRDATSGSVYLTEMSR